MTNLSPINQFRKLYYEEDLEIVQTKKENDVSRVEFSDGTEVIGVEGSDEEFASVVSNLVRTVQDGDTYYIDIRDTPVSSKDGFQNNLNKFEVSTEDIKTAKRRINNQSSDLPKELDFRFVFDACLESDFEDELLIKVIDNYADAMVLLKHREKDMKKTYTRSILGQPALRNNVTIQYKQEFDEIFENYLFQYPPLEAGKIYREEFQHDMGFLLERVNKINELENEEWASLVNRNNMPSEDLAIERLLRAYGKRYEILRDILRSYAYLLKRDSNDNVDLNSTRRVIEYLDRKGYSFIQNVIIPEFRNGISHESMQMEDGTLEIYEDRIRAEEPEKELSTHEVADNLLKLFELFYAVIYSYSIKEEEFLFNIFSSEEFKYYVAENYV